MEQDLIKTLRTVHLGLFRLLAGKSPLKRSAIASQKEGVSSEGVGLIKVPTESQSTAQTAGLLSGLKSIVHYYGYALNASLNASGMLGFYFLNQQTALRFFELFDEVHADPVKGNFRLRISGIYDTIGMFREGRLHEIIQSHKIELPELNAIISNGNPALMIGIHHIGILTELRLDWINQTPVLQKAMMADPTQSIPIGKPLDIRPCNLAERSLFMAVCLRVEPVLATQ